MDCDTFEAWVRSARDGELDELTSSALKKHLATCTRCSSTIGGEWVSSTARRSDDHAPKVTLGRRVARAVSIAGNWAMRPQTAMAALFLVMIGTSFLLLREKSSRAPANAEITVTEEGTPAPTTTSSPAQGAEPLAAAYDAAMRAYREGRFDDAQKAFETISPGDTTAELWAARAVREGRGCGAAAARFDEVAKRAAGTSTGWEALIDGGRCYASLGNIASARTRFESLLGVDSFRDRARAEIERLAHTGQSASSP